MTLTADPSRRSFIDKLGKGALLAPLATSLSSSLFAQNTEAKPYGVALVGLGNYALSHLAPALQQTQNCKLTALVSGTAEKRSLYGELYQIPESHLYTYNTFDEIRHNPDVDIVYVVLPNAMHAEYVIRAAQAGKHVIAEKPMGVSAEECQSMIEACQKAGVTLNVGYRSHYDPGHRIIKQIAREQPKGPAKYVQADHAFIIGDPTQWRLKKSLAGGGALYDLGIYCIQAARYATGKNPVAVSAQETKTDPVKFAEVDETVSFHLEFDDGAIANCTTSYNFRSDRLYVAYAKQNSSAEIRSAFSYSGQETYVNGRLIRVPEVSQQVLQMDGICQHIKDRTLSPISGEEGLIDMQIIEAIESSIATGGARTRIRYS